MALESQQVDYLFTKGLNEDVSDVVDAEGLDWVVNARFGKEGELKKRPGLALGVTDTSWRNHASLVSTGRDIAMVSSQGLNLWNEAAGTSGLVRRAPFLPCKMEVQPVTRAPGNVVVCDGSYYTSGSLACHVVAWQTDPPSASATVTPTYVSVVDANTGSLLLGPHLLSSGGRNPRVITLASLALVFWADTARDIWATQVTFTSGVPAIGTTTRVVSTASNQVNGVPLFDVCTDGTYGYISYNASTTTTKRITSAGGVSHTYAEATDSAVNGAWNYHINGSIVVAYTTGGAVDITVRQLQASDLTSQQYYTTTTGTTNDYERIVIGATTFDGNQWYFVGGCDPSDTDPSVIGALRRVDGGGSPVTGLTLASNFVPMSKMFTMRSGNSTDEFLPALIGYQPRLMSGTQPGVYAVAFYNSSICDTVSGDAPSRLSSSGKLLFAKVHSSADPSSTVDFLPSVYAHGSDYQKLSVALRVRTGIRSTTSGTINYDTGVDIVTLDYSQASPLGRVAHGSVAYMAGAVPAYFDGQFVSEMQAQYAPVITSATESGSGTLTNGTYTYKATYEWVDYTGLLHRSAPSAAVSVTIAAGKDATVVVATSQIQMHRARYEEGAGATTSNDDNVYRIVLYRTKASGTVYYKVATYEVTQATASTVTFTDTEEDSTLSDETLLYTTGGILENVAPPASVDIALGNKRLWLIDAEDQRRIWFSKPLQPGIAPEFSDSLTLVCDKKITAIEVLDDKLVCFARDDIFVVAGEGPDATGVGSFSGPTPLESPVGCTNVASIAKTGDGIYFASARSIELLTRSLQVLEPPIGAALRDTYSATAIVSADYCALDDEVRFLCNTTANSVLVWNMRRKTWSTWDFLNYPNIDNPIDCEYVINEDGTANWYVLLKLDASGTLSAALTTMDSASPVYADGGTFYGMDVQTPLFRFGGLRNRVRVRNVALLLKRNAATSIAAYATVDGHISGPIVGDNGASTTTFSSTELGNANSGQGEGTGLLQWSLPVQKCNSVSFRFEEQTAGTADTQGVTLYGLSMEVGMKGGRARLPDTRRS